MVVAQVIHKRIVGNRENLLLQILQIPDSHNFFVRLRIYDNEVSESEMLIHFMAEHLGISLRVLVDKRSLQFIGIHLVCHIGTLQYKRNYQPRLPHVTAKLVARIRIFFPCPHKTHVGDYAEHVILVTFKNTYSLLVITRQLYLRAAAHSKSLQVTVQSFF